MHHLQDKINSFKEKFEKELNTIHNEQQLEEFRIHYLGRTGQLTSLMQSIKELSKEEKVIFGPILNNLKKTSEQEFELKRNIILEKKLQGSELKKINFDVTAYKVDTLKGSLHPYTYVIEEIENVFITMGYEIIDGPELEEEYHNFEALNIPSDHPARDIQDTFWLQLPKKLMRTHTSPVQIRAMEKQKPPLAMFATGRCYRNEATDASHDFVFMQAECLVVDKNISMSNLLATIKVLLQAIFKKGDLDIRTRPGYFPFVEPGIEVDMQCPFCNDGCSVCKKTRWIEMGGAGLVHPNVLKNCNIDPMQYSGFAFGFGLTRLVMLKYGINDIRLLNSGKLEFLDQF